MPFITLTTDWGLSDFYVAALKGAILSRLPQATLVDISHGVAQYDEAEAAFALRNAYPHFPPNTIHVMGVGWGWGDTPPLLLMAAAGHHFISVANHCLSLMFLPPSCVVSVASKGSILEVLPPLLQKLTQGAAPEELGTPTTLPDVTPLEPVLNFRPSATGEQEVGSIAGRILHIDSYGNAITNISRKLYHEHVRGRSCTVFINSNRYKVPQIFDTYTDVESGENIAFFNSLGLLEVGVCYGNARNLLRLSKENSTITIVFNS